MKIGVVGSRTFNDYELFNKKLIEHLSPVIDPNIEFISGGAVGADTLIRKWVEKHRLGHIGFNNPLIGFKLTEYLPDYEKYGKAAPLQRNQKIAEESDILIAFWNGESRGTLHTVRCAIKLGKDVRLITIGGEK